MSNRRTPRSQGTSKTFPDAVRLVRAATEDIEGGRLVKVSKHLERADAPNITLQVAFIAGVLARQLQAIHGTEAVNALLDSMMSKESAHVADHR